MVCRAVVCRVVPCRDQCRRVPPQGDRAPCSPGSPPAPLHASVRASARVRAVRRAGGLAGRRVRPIKWSPPSKWRVAFIAMAYIVVAVTDGRSPALGDGRHVDVADDLLRHQLVCVVMAYSYGL